MKCAMAQDLMPLVIDEIASEETREELEGHLKTCEGCRHVYELMARRTPVEEGPTEEETAFIRFCKRLERSFSVRRLICWLLVAGALGCVLGYASFRVYHSIYADGVEMPGSWFDATVLRKEDGSIWYDFSMRDGHDWHNWGWAERFDPNSGIYYVCPLKPAWEVGQYEINATRFIESSYDQLVWKDGALMCPDWENGPDVYVEDSQDGRIIKRPESAPYVPVTEIRAGTETDYRVIWTEGEEIPLVNWDS